MKRLIILNNGLNFLEPDKISRKSSSFGRRQKFIQVVDMDVLYPFKLAHMTLMMVHKLSLFLQYMFKRLICIEIICNIFVFRSIHNIIF